MAVTKVFQEAVKSGDVMGVRIMLKDILLLDLTFNDFNEMLDYARNMPGLFDEHDGKEFILDPTEWNDDYMNKQMVQIIGNFSHERLEHLKKVVEYLRPAPQQTSTPVNQKDIGDQHQPHSHAQGKTRDRASNRSDSQPRKSYAAQKAEDERNGRIVKVVGGAVVGGLVGGVGALTIGSVISNASAAAEAVEAAEAASVLATGVSVGTVLGCAAAGAVLGCVIAVAITSEDSADE